MNMAIRLLVVVSMSVASHSAKAGTFDGWCFAGDGCTGAEAINNDKYDRCEDSCEMNTPVDVRGLEARLYDVRCAGDNGVFEFRMMLMEYVTDGTRRALAIDNFGAIELQRCGV